MKTKTVLVACEESQAVTIELRRMGIIAYSCDKLPCSGDHPEWHLRGDVLNYLSYPWNMMIAFPPCTHLAVSGARWFKDKKIEQRQAIEFFMALWEQDQIPKIAIENPIGIMSTWLRKPDQIIQPWQFGHGETKATCLWLKNLPKLIPTNVVGGREGRIWKMPPSDNGHILRSKTYPGIAKAIATQWGNYLINN